MFVDGASKGNPGPAGIGVVLMDEHGAMIAEIAEPLGETTNNVAEYRALIRGLEECIKFRAASVTVNTDSQLLARQMEGKYKINAPHLRALYNDAHVLCKQFIKGVKFEHVLRAGNARADQLANEGCRKN